MIMYMSPMPAIIKCQRICFYVYSSAMMIGMLKVTFQSKRSEKCILYTKNDLLCPDIEFSKLASSSKCVIMKKCPSW